MRRSQLVDLATSISAVLGAVETSTHSPNADDREMDENALCESVDRLLPSSVCTSDHKNGHQNEDECEGLKRCAVPCHARRGHVWVMVGEWMGG